MVDGNFGADPKPPHSASNDAASWRRPASINSAPGFVAAGLTALVRPMASINAPMFCLMSAGRLRHTSSIASINCKNCGRGKYVPP